MRYALLVVDPNVDFFAERNGALGAKGAEKIIGPWNRIIAHARALGWPIFVSRDWHDPDMNLHFRKFPRHCVRDTPGAALHPDLDAGGAIIISKGMNPDEDSFSPFTGFDSEGRSLEAAVERLGVTDFFFGGLVTEFCVKAAGIDGREKKFGMHLLFDATCALDINPGDGDAAIAEMVAAGIRVTTVDDVIAAMR